MRTLLVILCCLAVLCSGCVAIGTPGDSGDESTKIADLTIANSLDTQTTVDLLVRNRTTGDVIHEEQLALERNESREYTRFDDGGEFNATVAVGNRTNSKVFWTTESNSVGLYVIVSENRIRMMRTVR